MGVIWGMSVKGCCARSNYARATATARLRRRQQPVLGRQYLLPSLNKLLYFGQGQNVEEEHEQIHCCCFGCNAGGFRRQPRCLCRKKESEHQNGGSFVFELFDET